MTGDTTRLLLVSLTATTVSLIFGPTKESRQIAPSARIGLDLAFTCIFMQVITSHYSYDWWFYQAGGLQAHVFGISGTTSKSSNGHRISMAMVCRFSIISTLCKYTDSLDVEVFKQLGTVYTSLRRSLQTRC